MDDDFSAQLDKAMARSINFLLRPLSVDLNENSKAYGGFYGLVDVNKNDGEPFIFSEITAYAVRILLKLYSWTKEERYRDIAILAGNWLLTAQYRGDEANARGAFYDKFYTQRGAFDDAFYVYPNATCIGALVDLYELTKESKYLDAAKSCLKWLLTTLETSASDSGNPIVCQSASFLARSTLTNRYACPTSYWDMTNHWAFLKNRKP
ncbi:MAG: hypothetical protein C4294_17195 [Nitrospiraceae bacterium]